MWSNARELLKNAKEMIAAELCFARERSQPKRYAKLLEPSNHFEFRRLHGQWWDAVIRDEAKEIIRAFRRAVRSGS
jgi:hypothetical protein